MSTHSYRRSEFTPHDSLMTVLGEMWQELQKFPDSGEVKLCLTMQNFHGSAAIRAEAGYKLGDQAKWLKGAVYPFHSVPATIETTMLFRELSNRARAHSK